MQNSPLNPDASQEIDFSSMLKILWEQKWIVIGVAFIVTLLAAVYAFMSTPVYEARAYVIPPTQNEIANFNYGRNKDAELVPYSVKDVYDVFSLNLQSESLRQKFYEEKYLPTLSREDREVSKTMLYSQFNKKLVVQPPTKDVPDRYLVIVQNKDPVVAKEWVDTYIELAGERGKREMITNVTREAEVRSRNLAQQIESLRETGKQNREDAIIKLREARDVASAINLDKPPIITGNPAVELAGSMEGQLIYMRGTKALEAEIKNLEARVSDDPFIGRLRELQAKYNFYKELHVSTQNVAVYRVDGAVGLPDTPVKPKKVVITLLGLLGGLILGGMVAVAYRLLWRREAQL